MPFVSITLLKGRTPEQKKAMVESVTDAISKSIDVDPNNIWVRIDEMEKEDFAVGGKQLVPRN